MNPHALRMLGAGAALAALLVGCSDSDDMPFEPPPVRPVVQLEVAPTKGDSTSYLVHLEWSATDSDGQVVGYQYAVDPPAMPGPGNDTTWVDTQATTVDLTVAATRPPEPLPPPGTPIASSDYHTVVVRAIDDDDLHSAPVSRSFTAYTVAPYTNIVFPNGNAQGPIVTPDSFRVAWQGTDPDGAGIATYKFRLATAEEIDPLNPTGISAAQLQAFFGADAPGFATAGWDSLPGDSAGYVLDNLSPHTTYFFAVVAVDHSGAYEPRFNQDSNVLRFWPTLDTLGPRITVWNEYFSRTQIVSGVSLDPSRIYNIELPVSTPVTFNWSAAPQGGSYIVGYRWAVDIADINDETPRKDPSDLAHWSPWSLGTSATVGPFTADPPIHHFYLEALDAFGLVTLFTIRMNIVVPTFDRPLLVIDDLYGTPTQLVNPGNPGGPIQLSGAYPMEAEQDSFLVARGGFPDSLSIRSSGTFALSQPGAFADFWPDTLDYRFYPHDGLTLEDLSRYKAVAWYTDSQSAQRSGSKFGSVSPMTGLRSINSVNRLNTLAVYLRQGGKVWLFGEGATSAIANGYWTRYAGNPPASPYTSGDDPRQNVLYPGNFLHDFCHLRSELLRAGGPAGAPAHLQLVACQPFLPAWQPLQPGAARTAQRWSDLPRLTVAAYRGAPASPGVSSTWVIHRPLWITDGSPTFTPSLDTLYTYEARTPDPDHVYAPLDVDGYPNAVFYHGEENGPGSQLVWFGFPLHYFEREQARTVVQSVMRNFGIMPGQAVARGKGSRRT
jgi:hypothetical protein